MFSRIDIREKLLNLRTQRIKEENILDEVYHIFRENEKQRQLIEKALNTKSNTDAGNDFDFDLLDSRSIFHLNDIREICVTYRLRFLDSHYFKGEIPEEAISKIRDIENKHQTKLGNFKIVAPAKLLKLENADDPLLFAPIGNGYFYLIHKWGRDLNPFRKLLMWPYKNFDNLTFTVVFLSVILTILSPMHWFSQSPNAGNYIFLFLIILNGVGGLVLFYGIAKGKNFNNDIWNSKYYNG
ncbi:hypothetical protein EI546_02970 [Aequorivita sp. H23M31]|uniref:Uncharacterized protein n=1 Tax=Aequorivita ciconiae TaxID=2494375 RepID=A0A410G0F1_9FLAO|nr:hypothetical protein [Aequorivita sp. H23M31]QAA80754.1 hypothetical protein EI546_02970 [Aequorivita sp. H23M31]